MNEIQHTLYPGRAPAIIALGILAFIICGPVTGVPAWIMANQDLRDLRAGIIPDSSSARLKAGRLLAIAGTFLSPLWLWLLCIVGFVLFMVAGEMVFTMF